MRSNALYFPYISIPENSWTIKNLLYWDKLSSIVPMDHIDRPEQLSHFMRSLLERDLVEQVFPSNYLYEIPEFESSFIRYLRPKVRYYRENPLSPFSHRSIVAPKVLGGRVHHEKLMPTANLHIDKLGQLPDFLIQEGLARRVDTTWFELDTRVANMFMAYLAICLGGVKDVDAAPITSEFKYSSFLGHFRRDNSRFNHQRKASDVIINGLLPTPNEHVDLDKLVRFKSDHGHLLPALRRKVENESARIALLYDPVDRIEATKSFVESCIDEKNQIIEAMKPTWSKISFGSIVPLFGSGLAMVATDTGNKAAFAGAGLSFAATAYQALNSIRAERKRVETLPLAYLAHLDAFKA